MAGYETQDPNSLDQVQNQPGFDDQSDDESNYGGGDQSNSVGGRGGESGPVELCSRRARPRASRPVELCSRRGRPGK